MRRTATLMAALAAILTAAAAPVRTATENFVTNKIEEIRTNTYTKAETDARIAELAPLGITTNDVCNIVTNVSADWYCELGTLTKRNSNFWRGYWYGAFIELQYRSPYWHIESDGGFLLYENVEGSADATYLVFKLEEGSETATTLGTTSIELVRRNALDLARLTDIAPTVSNTVTKAYVEGLGIESGVDAQTVTNMTALTPVYSQTPTFSEWTISSEDTEYVQVNSIEWGENDPDYGTGWYPVNEAGDRMGNSKGTLDSETITWTGGEEVSGDTITATRTRTDVIGYTLGAQTNSVLAATNSLISASITNGFVTASITNGLVSTNFSGDVKINGSLSQGYDTPASGNYSHAEGMGTTASGNYSHAEGMGTTASRYAAHSEGDSTTASGYAAHSEGFLSIASNDFSFVWQGSDYGSYYGSHGGGTFNINPNGGLSGFWIGESNISNILTTATNSLAKSLAPTITNIASTVSSNAIANADTTYRRTIGITNLNQSVQYVNITAPSPSTLAISIPTDGATKDWMVYVTSVTNVSLVLPPATWWMADVAYTNDVPPAKPTALWFSQVTDGIFILGRQDLTEVTP